MEDRELRRTLSAFFRRFSPAADGSPVATDALFERREAELQALAKQRVFMAQAQALAREQAPPSFAGSMAF